jgi:hypothetical protein
MGKTTDLRRELKATFFPLLESKGFAIDTSSAPTFTRFRRTVSECVHLVEVQWDKYGRPRFVVNFGACPHDGMQIRGEHFPVEKVFVGWLAENGRLQPRRGHSSANWFSQEPSLLLRLFGLARLRAADAVVSQLMSLFPEVEAYWTMGVVGRHLMMFRTSAK